MDGEPGRSEIEPIGDAEFLEDVVSGLSRPRKAVPGKYLWDEAGSLLFDRICDGRDYYLTRRETALLRENAAAVAGTVGAGAHLVEFGSGASVKVRVLLDALEQPRRYVAVDIAKEHLEAAAGRIARDYPGLDVVPVSADYTKPLSLPTAEDGGPVLGFYPGSTIGNFPPEAAVAFLERVRAALGRGWLLIGVDPTRDRATLARAYADGEGLMAAFHGNLLARVNRELGGDLDPSNFRHEARVLDHPSRVEAHLVASRAATYRVGGREIAFEPGESIHTDTSHKYDSETFRDLAARAGWETAWCRLDREGLFGLHLLRADAGG